MNVWHSNAATPPFDVAAERAAFGMFAATPMTPWRKPTDADQPLDVMNLTAVIQVASVRPQYGFASTAEDEMGNATNRSPYPTLLHLLQGNSGERAGCVFSDADKIFKANIRTPENLGPQAWAELQARCKIDSAFATTERP